MSPPVAPSPFYQSRMRFISLEAAGWWEVGSWAWREVDAVEFQHDFPPKSEGVGFVKDEVEATANRAPFVLEDGLGGVGGGGDLFGRGLACSCFGGEVGDFVFDAGAD